jgi:hypothetical protein
MLTAANELAEAILVGMHTSASEHSLQTPHR